MARRITPIDFIACLGCGAIGLYWIYLALMLLGVDAEPLVPYFCMAFFALAAFSFTGSVTLIMTGNARAAIAGALFLAGIMLLICAGIYAVVGYLTHALHGALGGLGLIGASLVIAWRTARQPEQA